MAGNSEYYSIDGIVDQSNLGSNKPKKWLG